MNDERIESFFKLATTIVDDFSSVDRIQLHDTSGHKVEGFAANHVYASVFSQTKSLHLFMKLSKEFKDISNELLDMVNRREVLFYSSIIPSILHFGNLYRSTEKIPIPKPYLSLMNTSNQSVIVLQDLKALGYELRTQIAQTLNFADQCAAISAMGRFQGWMNAYADSLDVPIEKFLRSDCHIYEVFADAISTKEKRGHLAEGFAKYLPQSTSIEKVQLFKDFIINDYFDHYKKLFAEQKNSGFVSLTHNDFWANNILFKQNQHDNSVTEAIIVDWQCWNCGSVAWDLASLLVRTSADLGVTLSDDNTKFLLEAYLSGWHSSWNACQRKWKNDWNFDALYKELLRNIHVGYYGLIICGDLMFANIDNTTLTYISSKILYLIENYPPQNPTL